MFVANPEIVAQMSATMQRIINSGRQPALTPELLLKAKLYYAAHPSENSDVLFYPDGTVITETEFSRLITSRNLQVAYAQSHGWFPVVIGRNCCNLWTWKDC